jgi:uncharacterized membrane protein
VTSSLLRRVLLSRARLLAGAVFGLLVWACIPSGTVASTRVIVGWDAGVLLYLGLSAPLSLMTSPAEMPAHAEAQEDGEWTIFGITLGVVIISFIAVGNEFATIKNAPSGQRSWQILLVAVTLFISWLMTHVTFAYRYAHEYYERNEAGGLDKGLEFPGEPEPDYMDFLYFALVLGMTFQVSDVQITSRKLRRVAVLHGLLGFLFNAIIIALTVNIAAGLAG